MFSLLLKKNYSISILHGSESLPVVVITIHPPKGRQATLKGQPTCCQSLYGSPGASWQDKQAEGEAVPDAHIWYILFARFAAATQYQGCQTGD